MSSFGQSSCAFFFEYWASSYELKGKGGDSAASRWSSKITGLAQASYFVEEENWEAGSTRKLTCGIQWDYQWASKKTDWVAQHGSHILTRIFLGRLQPTRPSTTLKRQKIKVEKQMLMPPACCPPAGPKRFKAYRPGREKPSPSSHLDSLLLSWPAPLPLSMWLSRPTHVSWHPWTREGPGGPCPLKVPLPQRGVCLGLTAVDR